MLVLSVNVTIFVYTQCYKLFINTVREPMGGFTI